MSKVRSMCQEIRKKKLFRWLKKTGKIMKNKSEKNGKYGEEEWQQRVKPKTWGKET